MAPKNTSKICLVPRLAGLGGTASFQSKLTAGLVKRGVEVTYDLHDPDIRVILVVGGTRYIREIERSRARGALVVQRLDGINWVHRRRYTGVRHFLRAEINNRLIAYIRRRLADHIVYQSKFVKGWWQEQYGNTGKPEFVIHNGVDLSLYNPKGPGELPKDIYRLLLVEGRLGGGYHMGLENAVELASQLQNLHRLPVSLRVIGEVPGRLRDQVKRSTTVPIEWLGVIERMRIPEQDRSAHALFSADLNAACPNAVIEALACGLPVLAFDTGALGELVTDGSGQVTDYGGDVWRLDPPDVKTLADASVDVFKRNPQYRRAARALAEKRYDLEQMIDSYCEVWDRI